MFAQAFTQDHRMVYLDDPIRMYACHGNDPNPASSPPTIRRWAVCFAIEIPQPVGQKKKRGRVISQNKFLKSRNNVTARITRPTTV
jgi:hypothetical protein